jgi:F0F1-type ATP synthase membrane subunit c/vacuolar-type H+-ATPase subunit K
LGAGVEVGVSANALVRGNAAKTRAAAKTTKIIFLNTFFIVSSFLIGYDVILDAQGYGDMARV